MGTNNVFQTPVPAGDVVTTIAPSLEAAVDTTRLSGTLRYTPAVNLYATYTANDGVSQVGEGRLLAALVPGLFYVDTRAAASVVPTLAGYIPGSGQLVAGNDLMQTYTAQITPFLVHRLGSAATVQAGYSFQYATQGYGSFSQSNALNVPDDYIANRGFAVVRSGEEFGRLALQARADGTKYAGNGIYDDAHTFITALETRYAILRSVALLGEIGYENQAYSGTNPVNISDAVWSVGLRLTPRPRCHRGCQIWPPKRLQFLLPECGRSPWWADRSFRHLPGNARHDAHPGTGSARDHHGRCAWKSCR